MSAYQHANILFNPDVLRTFPETYPESAKVLGDRFQVRPLQSDDYSRCHTRLLSQLTTVGDVSSMAWRKQYNAIQAASCYYIVVIEDRRTHELAASGTLMLEHKFIHECGIFGHIEDIVVSKEYRGLQLGVVIMEALKHIGQQVGCYKLALDCADHLEKFYNRTGFAKKEMQMVIYLDRPASASASSSAPHLTAKL